MKQFQMTPNSEVKLTVAISSAAIVGSNVSINDKMIKKSIAYKFTTQLGRSNDLKNKILTSFSNFSTHNENAEDIINATKVVCTVSDSENSEQYTGKLVKIHANAYVIYIVLELT